MRAVTLRQAAVDSRLFEEVVVVKNTHSDVRRYLEALGRLIKVRVTKHPQVYMLTFRGYEVLPLVRLITVGKTLLYDEFINPVEWFVHEHAYLRPNGTAARVLRSVYRWLGMHVALILTDTASHAAYSATLMDIPQRHYGVLPVGTDEITFKPLPPRLHHGFRVLYYGSMLPLHGIEYVIEAAIQLAHREDIIFHLVGGKQPIEELIDKARIAGAHIEYDRWIDYTELPVVFSKSDLCLAGPFGGTTQARFVITGKTFQFLAAARPTVIGVNQETTIFTDKENTLLVPQANTRALATAIAWAADHQVELSTIGTAGRRVYEATYAAPHLATALVSLFEKHGLTNVQHRRHQK